jgi:CSLREA domain-containing protein
MTRASIVCLLTVALISVLAWIAPAPALAKVFIVNSFFDDADAHDANPGDGICADTYAACTLRAAIEEANK